MRDNPQKFLEVALQAVKKAEPIFRKSFGKPSGVVEKQQGIYKSPVTDADKAIETVITSVLAKEFPAHSISGEEFPAQKKQSPYTWYIDPIDGTISYIRGLPCASISLGLWKEETPMVALIVDPLGRTAYSAIRGKGAFKNGKERLSVSSVARVSDGLGSVGRMKILADDLALQRVARMAYRGRAYGGGAFELCYIAEGKLDFSVSERIKVYDVAAGMLILAEAGGTATDWEGKPFVSTATQFAASNGKIHEELLETLRG
ncbi:MAG: Inositol-1-monophosphatase (IMPase) [Parcubacteria group bacterium GW2011_GWF2_50_9]|nr:MAG: Inositol-1-monophosphatase (IMPase) [Parcubacteria group bacterium GW2011_GWF2_50_9]OHA21170.1 MAG: hypothetical protein A2759_01640 [Candidatus Taylorbacteria bacterium RIFCSPHIGHO2_01_FULL_49_60]